MATHLLPDQRRFMPGRTITLDVPHIGVVTVRGLPVAQVIAIATRKGRSKDDARTAMDVIAAGTVEPQLDHDAQRASIQRAGSDDHLLPIVGAILDLSGVKEAVAAQGPPGAIKAYAYR